jgi:uncharacterized protein YndB with AHSA1/START domain
MESIKLSATIPTDPETLFKAWLSSKEHSKFTGGKATASLRVNAMHSSWDGYIAGINKEIIPYKKIVQTWRSNDFSGSDEDSVLELKFEKKGKSTLLRLHHYNIPKGQAKAYKQGWKDHYFTPMKKYYSNKK